MINWREQLKEKLEAYNSAPGPINGEAKISSISDLFSTATKAHALIIYDLDNPATKSFLATSIGKAKELIAEALRQPKSAYIDRLIRTLINYLCVVDPTILPSDSITIASFD